MAERGASEVDRSGAWQWVLGLDPTAFAGTGPHARIALDRPGVGRLAVGRDGTWSSDVPLTPDARDVLDLFLPLRVRTDFVVAQLGQSLDGRIATESGHSHYINGPDDIRRLHGLRALADVVVVGAGTVEADDPRLTVREVQGDDPARVVLDPRGRVSSGRRIFERPGPPVVWMRGAAGTEGWGGGDGDRGAAGEGGAGAAPPGVDVEVLALDPEGRFDPHAVLRALARRGWRRVLVEGGGLTVSRFLQAGALDRLHVSVAPLILGSGRPGFTLPTIRTLDEGLRLPARHFRLGADLLFDLDLAR